MVSKPIGWEVEKDARLQRERNIGFADVIKALERRGEPMAGAKGPAVRKTHRDPAFFDSEEQEMIETFEQALESGELSAPSAEEIAAATLGTAPVFLR